MRYNLLKFVTWFLMMDILFTGCIPGSSQLPSPSPNLLPEPTPIPTAAIIANPSLKGTSPDVLNACPVEEQALAMRKSQIPDWKHIGIFACYLLSLDLSDSSGIYMGKEILVFHNQTTFHLNEIVFRVFPNAQKIYGGKMSIQTVMMEGKDLSFDYFLSDLTGLRIRLDHPLQPDDTARIELAFRIEMPLDFNSDRSYGIFNQSSSGPELNLANFYPILAVFKDGNWHADPVLMGGDAVTSQTALFKVSITAPLSWKIASTGVQIQQIDEHGLSRHDFVSGPVRDFMVTASPTFEMRQTQLEDISIVQWGPIETEPGWNIALKEAKNALAYYENTFGPYPFNELDIVAVKLQNASGVEYPGLVLIIDGTYQSPQRYDFLSLVIAHEIAHQWWYSIIGNDVLINPWQDEGLATFSSLMVLETSSPDIDYIGRYESQVKEYNQSNPRQSIDQPLNAFQERLQEYGLVVYLKGALFFNAVRNEIGYLPFMQALKSYYLENKYQLVNPVNLLDSFTQACKCSLTAIYQEYGVQPVNP